MPTHIWASGTRRFKCVLLGFKTVILHENASFFYVPSLNFFTSFSTCLSIATSQYPMPVRDVAARPHADLASVGVVLILSRYRQDSYLCMCKLSCIRPRDQWLPDGRAECTIYRSCRVSCQLVRLGTALRNAKQVLSRLRKIGRVTFARRSWWVGDGIQLPTCCATAK